MEQNELTFWVCYRIDEAGKYNYLGDGKGHIRLFKSEEALSKFLDENKVDKENVFTHAIKGLFAVPEPEIKPEAIKLYSPKVALPPSAQEQLAEWKKKRKRMA